MNEVAPNPLSEALNRLWAQHLGQLKERVAILTAGAHTLAAETIDPVPLAEACSAAHKLAGVLGTFGLHEGTELAREAERLCGAAVDDRAALSLRLLEIVDRLSTLIAQKR